MNDFANASSIEPLSPPLPGAGGSSRFSIADVIRMLRPVQWVKNGFVLIPLVLSKEMTSPAAIREAFEAVAIFCVVTSAVYIMNDIADRRRDREHPEKKTRPIASGRIPVSAAIPIAAVLVAVGFALAWGMGLPFTSVLGAYVLLNVAYSFVLKHVAIIELFAIAANYVLRLIAGTVVIHETITSWTLILATLLALFLALGKRRGEAASLKEGAAAHRSVHQYYSPYFLDQLFVVTASVVIMSWTLYTLDPAIQARLHAPRLALTIPLVVYGVFRYQYLVQDGKGEHPSHTFLADAPLLATVALWIGMIAAARFVPWL